MHAHMHTRMHMRAHTCMQTHMHMHARAHTPLPQCLSHARFCDLCHVLTSRSGKRFQPWTSTAKGKGVGTCPSLLSSRMLSERRGHERERGRDRASRAAFQMCGQSWGRSRGCGEVGC